MACGYTASSICFVVDCVVTDWRIFSISREAILPETKCPLNRFWGALLNSYEEFVELMSRDPR